MRNKNLSFFLLRYFLLRFLALFNINNNKIINDEAFKDVNNNKIFKSDNEIIKTLYN